MRWRESTDRDLDAVRYISMHFFSVSRMSLHLEWRFMQEPVRQADKETERKHLQNTW